jgi:hypothetical protein
MVIDMVDVRSSRYEKLQDIEVAANGSIYRWGMSEPILAIDIRSSVEE